MKKLALLLGLVGVFLISCESEEITEDEREKKVQLIEKEEASEPGEF